tara:strand:- start:104 stop:292 length:189 start_codon:yes stop_codon:yes gene_type:complete
MDVHDATMCDLIREYIYLEHLINVGTDTILSNRKFSQVLCALAKYDSGTVNQIKKGYKEAAK